MTPRGLRKLEVFHKFTVAAFSWVYTWIKAYTFLYVEALVSKTILFGDGTFGR